ncbi:MAG: polyphosphate polymerase domain-containing protein [Lachnospiraceae bacterium]|nr:polyphosphate polymerase domain-containing protein [Lachnospiraceae bacterium]
MDMQMIFKRYEIKYLLTREQKERILRAAEPYMEPDQYGRSTVRNIYYDTDNYRLIRTSLGKPAYKEKLRVRSYQRTAPEDKVFVELKKKYDSVVYKRRIYVEEGQAMEYLAGRAEAPVHTQIAEEIDYFLQFYQTIKPRVFLSYDREAYAAVEETGFRVTFDENILFREEDLSLGSDVYGEALLPPEYVLMEIKTSESIPMWMARALSKEKVNRTSYSKYGHAFQKMFTQGGGELIYA